MVDASVGGKTGVDLGPLKNQVGVIINPQAVIIDPVFLNTLPANEYRSGYAEMLKHGLIQDAAYWKKLADFKKHKYRSNRDFYSPLGQNQAPGGASRSP